MTFDMNSAWSRAITLARENFSLLTVIAGIFVLLPTVAIYLLVPGVETMVDPSATSNMTPEQLMEILAPALAWGVPIMLVQFIGYNAMVALMGKDRPTVGEALSTGAKSMPSIIAAFVIFMVAYILVAIVAVIPITMLAAMTGVGALGAIAPFMVMAAAIFLMTRLSLTMPAVVIEDMLNPVRAMKRSWDLTSPHQWRVMGFWAVLVVAYLVISLLITGIISVIAALAGGGIASKLILGITNGVLAMVVGMVQCGLAVAIHGQLAGPGETEVTSTFE